MSSGKPNQGGERPLQCNFKPLKRETGKDIRKWKDVPCSWIGRINVVKITFLPKAIYRFHTIPTKILNSITELEKNYSKIQVDP